MKRHTCNILLFAFAACFLLAGLWGKCFGSVGWGVLRMLSGIKHLDAEVVMEGKEIVDLASGDELRYHDLLMDIDSLRNNLLGARVVPKEDTTVVKADSGSLCQPVRKLDEEELEAVVSRVEELKQVSEANGAAFLYCAAPVKEQYEQLPENVENHARENYEGLLQGLKRREIPTLSLGEVLEEELSPSEIFYGTDHHWRSYPGLLASSAICRELAERFGFSYRQEETEAESYTFTAYPDWFLGSKGKKVGRFFTWQGADDFELITPAFETSLTEKQPFKGESREGSFADTVLYPENLEKDYYHKNTYVTYSGGDFRLQILINRLKPEGKKVLLVRDSFGCAVSPFLALQMGELHVCDMRDFESFVGEKLDLEDYIREIRPDYVIVLYSGVSSVEEAHGSYDFF